MDERLMRMVIGEEERGIAKWGLVDISPELLLNAALEEIGEVAHAVNHSEGFEFVGQEIAEVIGVLSRLYNMVTPAWHG